VLHGDRQTGELLVGRIASLKRKLLRPRHVQSDHANNDPHHERANSQDFRIELVAPDGPFEWKLDPNVHKPNASTAQKINNDTDDKTSNDDILLRTWWHRAGDNYNGIEESLLMVHKVWNEFNGQFEGILGFSRGSRFAHIITVLNEVSGGTLFPNLRYVILASGYGNIPMPPINLDLLGGLWEQNLSIVRDSGFNFDNVLPLSIPSLHIMGSTDRLISIKASRALLTSYVHPKLHEHKGGHHVPMRAADVRTILDFIDSFPFTQSQDCTGQVFMSKNVVQSIDKNAAQTPNRKQQDIIYHIPDEEHTQAQIQECQSLGLIFPDEFQLLSDTDGTKEQIETFDENIQYTHPITYAIQLKPPSDQLEADQHAHLWPSKDISLKIEYTTNYPDVLPIFSLHHDLNLLEFKFHQSKACLDSVKKVDESEVGMPCVMSCVNAAREFFECGG
jgi:hypothetical protein